MAKWGEGDPRWLVEERPDATNPNNWHWVEKNATPWSKNRLNELFIGKYITCGPITINFVEITKAEGEATANNRKAKLIFLFEWVLNIKFTAKVDQYDTEYNGLLEIPNLSDENDSNEINVNVNIDTKGPHEADIRSILNTDGLKFAQKQCETYIRELKEEFSKGLILPTDKTKPQVVTTKGKTNFVNKQEFQNKVISSNTPIASTNPETVANVKKINLTDTFKVPPDRLYEIYTSSELIKIWGGKDATLDYKEGGYFSLLGGLIEGFFIKMIQNQEIIIKWRLRKYPENHFADIKLTFKDQADSTALVVDGYGVPEEHYNDTVIGFTRYYFQNVSRTFGIGLNLF